MRFFVRWDVSCLPWQVAPPDVSSPPRFCDSWEAVRFMSILDREDFGDDGGKDLSRCLSRCLPACRSADHRVSSVSTSRFRACDELNMGQAHLCTFRSAVVPARWSQDVHDAYANRTAGDGDDVPAALRAPGATSGRRLSDKLVFSASTHHHYDAYEVTSGGEAKIYS